ncbi:hypothetical protein HN51_012579 [Arachis hypogaea]|uniref:CCT domain-containing protein n=2 Tax=Arachis TaxID=3817 RepID=A0A445DTX2_ARAHY|nr:uncharacterized protein LOC107479916 [Arachis duranensis]XP_025689255.1 putative uncharacterized protein DDB_G0281733 [Arachis hypogaea]QHO58078.1 zinc finger protein [Arachis hypogaea]RYR66619.1 hypothetical protein Ahy_A03g012650 [Arachis hypogaea]
MSSGLYSFETTFQAHSSSDMVTADGGDLAFLTDPFPFFENSTTNNDIGQHCSSNQSMFDEALSSSSVDPFSSCFFSFSPPSIHLENLSLQTNNKNNRVDPNLESDFASFSSGFDVTQVVKSEECQIGVEFDYGYNNHNHQHFFPHSYSGAENVAKYMQRSFSSNSFHGKPGNFLFQNNHSDTLNNNNNNNNMKSPSFQRHDMNSPENSAFNGQMRRVCSTGDLQKCQREGSLLEEPNFKVGRYSAEERKERISKYRAKRSQRNFNKTIKYACRKTLADNRPRIRGRFARNDEERDIIPIPNHKAPCSARDDEDEEVDFWIEGLRLHEEQEDVTVNAYGPNQFQYFRF